MPESTLDAYSSHVEMLEGRLAPYAKKSFEPGEGHQEFVDGGLIHKYYADLWQKSPERLSSRTPLQLERDRILYSAPMRKETEKYHVLYNGKRRIVRNYATHSMRMTQVTRSICRALLLNTDFAEAIAMGAKVGAVPFVHAAKDELAKWARSTIEKVDKEFAENDPRALPQATQKIMPFEDGSSAPEWINEIRSERIRQKVFEFVPWAAGKNTGAFYSSGQESYWLLCANVFTVESVPNRFSPETMFGIWRHSRGLAEGPGTFHHKMELSSRSGGDYAKVEHKISFEHMTYEATVVQYADDITWIIENLNDANSASLLNEKGSLYNRLKTRLRRDGELPAGLLAALDTNNAGGLYSYFIDDFLRNSREVLGGLAADGRAQLISGERAAHIGLSDEAQVMLDRIQQFLKEVVFTEGRVANRREMLRHIAKACADLLYTGGDEALPRVLEEQRVLEQWDDDQYAIARRLLDDPIHRVQLSIDVLASMGDQEIYDFVGIDSL